MPVSQETIDSLTPAQQAAWSEFIEACKEALEDEMTSAAESVGIVLFKSLLSEERDHAVGDFAFRLDPCGTTDLHEAHPRLATAFEALEKAGVDVNDLDNGKSWDDYENQPEEKD